MRHNVLEELLFVAEEEDGRCDECLKWYNAQHVDIESRWHYLALLVLWRDIDMVPTPFGPPMLTHGYAVYKDGLIRGVR